MKLIKFLIIEMRPKQWIKNMFIFAPVVFSQNFLNFKYIEKSFVAFFLFSFITGSIYIFNDCIDYENDKNHPKKRFRPIAAGKIKRRSALYFSIILLTVMLTAGYIFNSDFFLLALIYVILNILYSIYLKKIAVFDVFIIAIGFVLRVMIGGEVNNIYLSPWIFIITFLLALFLGLVKRRQELDGMDEKNESFTRDSLKNYSIPFLDQLISITTSATLISYIVYVVNPDVQSYFHTKELYLTVPFVIFGIFRYIFLTYMKNKGEVPEEIIFSDFPFLINIVLWILVFIFIIYF